jgi:ABC-2 type transport system ATP-binding protein
MDQPALLALNSVDFAYQRAPVLAGIGFAVQPGEVHALIGENGAGKTTLIRIALGLLAPDCGSAELFGVAATAIGPAERQRLHYVGERPSLLGHLRLSAWIRLQAARRARFDADYALQRLGDLGLGLSQRLGALSNGQRAQVALVCAVASRPDLLVLDDPGLGLDTRVRRALYGELIAMIAERPVGVLLTSHFLPEIERIADRTSILAGGRIVLSDSIDRIRGQACRLQIPKGTSALPLDRAGVLAITEDQDGLTVLGWRAELDSLAKTTGSEPAPVDLEQFFLALTQSETVRN